MLYAKQNDLLEQSCQIDAKHTALDGKIRDNELEFGKISQFPNSFTHDQVQFKSSWNEKKQVW